MKARLTFDLNEPDDARAHKRCIHSEGMALVIWEMIYNSRDCNSVEEMQEMITQKCERHGIIIDDLII
jgi:hypothetical protein